MESILNIGWATGDLGSKYPRHLLLKFGSITNTRIAYNCRDTRQNIICIGKELDADGVLLLPTPHPQPLRIAVRDPVPSNHDLYRDLYKRQIELRMNPFGGNMTIDSTREFSMMTPGVILTPSLCRRMATVLEDERPSGIVQLPEGDFFDSDGEPKKQAQILINPAFSEVIQTSSAIATKRDMRMGWYREDLLRVMDRFKQSSRIEDRWESAFNPRQWGAMEGTLEVFQDELGRWYRHTILSSWDHLPHFRETHILIKNLDW